ncbi:MAG: pre-toxin TG domain-containing protein, partial [Clostridium sp.]|nr:pre-toxin TG domain-containing protein [Clostridium sp.]
TISGDKNVTIDKDGVSTVTVEGTCYTESAGFVYENGSDRTPNEEFTDDDPMIGMDVAAVLKISTDAIAAAITGINAISETVPVSNEQCEENTSVNETEELPTYNIKGDYNEGDRVKVKINGEEFPATMKPKKDGTLRAVVDDYSGLVDASIESGEKAKELTKDQKEFVSFAVDCTPLGPFKDGISFVCGKDIITGEESSRAILAACIILPGVLDKGLKTAAKHGDEVVEQVSKHGDDVFEEAMNGLRGIEGAAEAISKGKIKHILNRHTFDRVKRNLEYKIKVMPRSELEADIALRSFFNPSWSEEKVAEVAQEAYDTVVKQGGTTGNYSVEVLGEKINVYIENGKFSTAYGFYHFTLDDFGL